MEGRVIILIFCIHFRSFLDKQAGKVSKVRSMWRFGLFTNKMQARIPLLIPGTHISTKFN
eukprot:m.145787 g.145787  ORF g.145787 m.145787 type:complete len:60 (+) comp16067_c0_seq11:2910-3089(+)